MMIMIDNDELKICFEQQHNDHTLYSSKYMRVNCELVDNWSSKSTYH